MPRSTRSTRLAKLASAFALLSFAANADARPDYITSKDDQCGLESYAAVGKSIGGMSSPKVKGPGQDSNGGEYCKIVGAPDSFEGGKEYQIKIEAPGFPGNRGAAFVLYFAGGAIEGADGKCTTQGYRSKSKIFTWVAPKGHTVGESLPFKALCGHYSSMYRADDVAAIASGVDVTTTATTVTTTTITSTITVTTTTVTTSTVSTTTLTTATTTTITTTIYDPGNVDCVEKQDDCTTACEAGSARNYQVLTPTNKKGKACVGATDCVPGENRCPPTTTLTTTTATTATATTVTATTKTTTSATATTTTNIYHADFMGVRVDMTQFLCINKDWDASTCHPGGPIIKDLILKQYAGQDMYGVWNENERGIHMSGAALNPSVLAKLTELNPALTAEATAEYIKCGTFKCTTTASTSTVPATEAEVIGTDEVSAAAAELAAAKAKQATAVAALEAAQLELDRIAVQIPASVTLTVPLEADLASLTATELSALKDEVRTVAATAGGYKVTDVDRVELEQNGTASGTSRHQRATTSDNGPITAKIIFKDSTFDVDAAVSSTNAAITAGTVAVTVTIGGATVTAEVKDTAVAAKAVGPDPDAVAAAEKAVGDATAAVAAAKAAVASATARVAVSLEVPSASPSKVALVAGLAAGITAVLGVIFSVTLLRQTPTGETSDVVPYGAPPDFF